MRILFILLLVILCPGGFAMQSPSPKLFDLVSSSPSKTLYKSKRDSFGYLLISKTALTQTEASEFTLTAGKHLEAELKHLESSLVKEGARVLERRWRQVRPDLWELTVNYQKLKDSRYARRFYQVSQGTLTVTRLDTKLMSEVQDLAERILK